MGSENVESSEILTEDKQIVNENHHKIMAQSSPPPPPELENHEVDSGVPFNVPGWHADVEEDWPGTNTPKMNNISSRHIKENVQFGSKIFHYIH